MDDRDLGELLRELPRIRVRSDFAAGVRRRIRDGRPAVRWKPVVSGLAAAAALVVAVAVRRDAVRKEAMQRETRAIARELEEMKRTLPSPVVDLGEENGVRYVIDLRRLPGRREGVL